LKDIFKLTNFFNFKLKQAAFLLADVQELDFSKSNIFEKTLNNETQSPGIRLSKPNKECRSWKLRLSGVRRFLIAENRISD
jgi:hypothetical protein